MPTVTQQRLGRQGLRRGITDVRLEVSLELPDENLEQYNSGRRMNIRNWSFIPEMGNQGRRCKRDQRVEIRHGKPQLRAEIQSQV